MEKTCESTWNVQQLMNSSMKNKYTDSELINSYRKAYVTLPNMVLTENKLI